tara:strand:+ start:590 stop:1159 length:570 start_codon:yes stop_codon:yes gene_type:complete
MFIQTEPTPNPSTLKFLPGLVLLESGTMEFKSKKDAETNELANALFTLDNVTGVFIGKDFLTITKSDKVEWEILKPTILSTILDFFSSGGSIGEISLETDPKPKKQTYSKKDAEMVEKINELLDERIKPAVAQDGGDINFVELKNGVVFLELRGACSGCPSSTITLKSGIENMLKYYIPEIKSVEAVNQ